MPRTLPTLAPTRDLFHRARFHNTGTFGALYYRSWPVPIPGPEGLALGYFYGPAERIEPTDGDAARVRLGAPTHLATVDAESGAFLELRAVSPQEAGLPGDGSVWLGEVPEAPADPPDVVAARRGRLFELYDHLMPFFAFSLPALTPANRALAGELVALFPQIVEAPLLGCYRSFGATFFTWAEQTR
jgi:hypothetical protein